jgi:hypothetical protein
MAVYKTPLKEEEGLLPLALAWVFRFGLLLWAFWCGKLLEEKRITEGKRIAKEELIESLRTLT